MNVPDLLYELKRQYPRMVTTWGQCRNAGCVQSARGYGECAGCIKQHLVDAGCDHQKIVTMESYLKRIAELSDRANDLTLEIIDEDFVN